MNLEQRQVEQKQPIEGNPNLALFSNLRGDARTKFFTGLSDKEVLALHQQLKPFDGYTPEELDRVERIGRQALESSSFTLEEEGPADFTKGRERVEEMHDLKVGLLDLDDQIGEADIKLRAGDIEQVQKLSALRQKRASLADSLEKLSPQLASRDARIFAGQKKDGADLPMFEFEINGNDPGSEKLN